MRDVVAVIGISLLAGLVAWLIGSLALRIVGVVFVLAGLVGMATGQLTGLFAAVIGLVVWLAGHWLYGVRHHGFASPLARRLFYQTPLRRIDPTRGWGIPMVSSERDDLR
jgi:hypothetical protein